MSRVLIAPVAQRLAELGVPEGAHVAVVAPGELGTIPLHAAPIGQGRALLDSYAVSYPPSLLALAAGCRRATSLDSSTAEPGPALAVIDPTADLPATELELAAMVQVFGDRVEVLLGVEATVDAVVARSAGAQELHFACHGQYELGRPFHSGLVLAERELLTLDWITTKLQLRDTRLVVMSACDSGVTDFFKASGESIGLPAAILEAGAAGVVGAMWSVSDDHTAQLMKHFYRFYSDDGMAPVHALRYAQLETRKTSTYPGPYLWGAFFAIGA